MAKIYPDTNYFLGFYQSAKEKLSGFEELCKFKSSLVLTDQTIDEFWRNRPSILNRLVSDFKRNFEINPVYLTLLGKSDEHEEIKKQIKNFKKLDKKIIEELHKIIDDESRDPIAQKFSELTNDQTVVILKLSDELIHKAAKRKQLGNPPCSDGKNTIGDEVIWEMLMHYLDEDLIILSKDQTFKANQMMLRKEYQKQGGRKLLLVTDKLSEAITKIGKKPTKELIQFEKESPLVVKSPCFCPEGPSPSGWEPNGRFLQVRCKKCGQSLSFQENPDME